MFDIVSLASICKLALDGGNKILEIYKNTKISETEKELLVEAAQLGEFYILSMDEVPSWIRVGKKDFPSDIEGDPAITEKYHDAFESLCKRGYIRHDDGILFRLTSKGFEKARQLVSG